MMAAHQMASCWTPHCFRSRTIGMDFGGISKPFVFFTPLLPKASHHHVAVGRILNQAFITTCFTVICENEENSVALASLWPKDGAEILQLGLHSNALFECGCLLLLSELTNSHTQTMK